MKVLGSGKGRQQKCPKTLLVKPPLSSQRLDSIGTTLCLYSRVFWFYYNRCEAWFWKVKGDTQGFYSIDTLQNDVLTDPKLVEKICRRISKSIDEIGKQLRTCGTVQLPLIGGARLSTKADVQFGWWRNDETGSSNDFSHLPKTWQDMQLSSIIFCPSHSWSVFRHVWRPCARCPHPRHPRS